MINCDKGYTWNRACECDMWCKPGQYLDYKRCVCKNKLIGRVITECTSLINETMINNKKNISNDDTITNILLDYFQCFYLLDLFVFAYLLISSGLKVKNYLKTNLKINMLIIKIIKWISNHKK